MAQGLSRTDYCCKTIRIISLNSHSPAAVFEEASTVPHLRARNTCSSGQEIMSHKTSFRVAWESFCASVWCWMYERGVARSQYWPGSFTWHWKSYYRNTAAALLSVSDETCRSTKEGWKKSYKSPPGAGKHSSDSGSRSSSHLAQNARVSSQWGVPLTGLQLAGVGRCRGWKWEQSDKEQKEPPLPGVACPGPITRHLPMGNALSHVLGAYPFFADPRRTGEFLH